MVSFLSLPPVRMKLFSENIWRYWRVKGGEMVVSGCPVGRQFRTGRLLAGEGCPLDLPADRTEAGWLESNG